MHGPVIVLKLGGSVLTGERSLARAVHEIYRWRREGLCVVAVASAFAGETDRLLASVRAYGAGPWNTASAAATGEQLAASLLGAALDRAGVPSSVLAPAAIGLRADGPPLEATPTALERRHVTDALERDGVAVVPGFCALDAQGRAVLLGRGGSDLTALFLADSLGARCRLVKDVHGLFEWDPAQLGPAPRRFASATWEDALATDGRILQHRAVRFAHERRLAFEVAAPGGVEATLVGSGPTRLVPPPEGTRPLRVALLGLGTVGAGVWSHVRGLPEAFEVIAVACRDRGRAEAHGVPSSLVWADPCAAAAAEVDVVVECLGGREPARTAVSTALAAGRAVVTSNKLLLAEDGAALRRLVHERGGRLLGSAAVGGSTPVLERVASHGRAVRQLRGVLNGTTNVLLERLGEGTALEDALLEARDRGLAERDATRDLDGRDAADKLRVLAAAVGAERVEVVREPLDAAVECRARVARESGLRLRQVAEFVQDGSRAMASVRLAELGPDDPLFDLPDAHNAVVLHGEHGALERVTGIGAGRWPTAEAVLGDLLELERAPRDLQGSACGALRAASEIGGTGRDIRSAKGPIDPACVCSPGT